jgi:hypothetical protein
VQKVATCFRVLKRPDELLERLTGLGSLGLSFYPSVLQSEALQARDRDDPRYRPRIPQDVTQRHMLANIILMAGEAITELIVGEVYAVKARVAPAALIKTETTTERTLNENDSTSASDRLCQPLHNHLMAPTLVKLRQAQVAVPPQCYLIDRPRTFCSCPDHRYRGAARHKCKHQLAVHLLDLWGAHAAKKAEVQVGNYLQSRCEGSMAENLAILRARMQEVGRENSSQQDNAKTLLGQLRERVERACLLPRRRVKQSGLKRGPERPEKKARHTFRRRGAKEDGMRPANLKGGANRGLGGLKRMVIDASQLGHAGGAIARMRRREQSRQKQKRAVTVKGCRMKNPRVLAAAKKSHTGAIQISVEPFAARVLPEEPSWLSRLVGGRFMF